MKLRTNRWPFDQERILRTGLSFQVISIGALLSLYVVSAWLSLAIFSLICILSYTEYRRFKAGVSLEYALQVMPFTFLMPVIPVWQHFFMPPFHRQLVLMYQTNRWLNCQPGDNAHRIACGKPHE